MSKSLLEQLSEDNPEVSFVASDRFMWSPGDQKLHYDIESINEPTSAYTLLHELGHALLGHASYVADTELVKLELEAWQKAKEDSKKYGVDIPEDHIQDCLDTYRDWLLSRASCPDCKLAGIQSLTDLNYTCLNCDNSWAVPNDQTCVVRRRKLN